MTELPRFELERRYDAPAALVWRTWTEPDLLARWYGPGVETVIHELDVRPGGVWKNEMRMRGMSSYQLTTFTEVEPARKLVMLMSSCDADWQVCANAMMPDWPKTLWTGVTFHEAAGKTRMVLTWVPHEASEAEIACFRGAVDKLGSGWGAGFGIIAEILVELA